MTFRKPKVINNRPSWPALHFRGKCRNDALIAKTMVMSAIVELAPKEKTGRGRKPLSQYVIFIRQQKQQQILLKIGK